MAIAVALETQTTKTRILETYLQTAYFGHGAFGISDACMRYFSKLPEDLTLSEAALLVSTLPSPEHLSPFRDRSGAEERMGRVLAAMQRQGFISEEVALRTRAAGLPPSLPGTPRRMPDDHSSKVSLFDGTRRRHACPTIYEPTSASCIHHPHLNHTPPCVSSHSPPCLVPVQAMAFLISRFLLSRTGP